MSEIDRRTRDGTRDPDHHPLERAVDKTGLSGTLNRLNAKIAEYRVFVYFIAAALMWFGWKTESPGARVTAVEKGLTKAIDSVGSGLKTAMDSIKAVRKGQDSTHNALEVLVRLNCFDTKTSFAEKRLAGLDCSDIEDARRGKIPLSPLGRAP